MNRNFPSGWGEGHESFVRESNEPWQSIYKGSFYPVILSIIISTRTFPGPHPLSEPETKALHKHMEKIRPDVLSAISVHSYGKDIYYPKVTEKIKK